MGRRKTEFEESLLNNRYSFSQYLEILTELAVSMFEWNGLPISVDERFLELTLFTDGKAVYFDDEVEGNLALKVTTGGGFNVYGIPIKRRAYAVNGYNRELDDKNSVIIWNNYLHTNSYLVVRNFARRLYNIDRTIDVNVNAQKTPVLVQGTEKQKLALEQIYKSYTGNEPAIFGYNELGDTPLKCLSTNAPYVADKLYQLKTEIWNEVLTYLGIANTNTIKKERLISDEVVRNMGGTIANRYSRLETRRQCAKQINKLFGTKIEVEFRSDYREMENGMILTGQTEDNSEKQIIATADTKGGEVNE